VEALNRLAVHSRETKESAIQQSVGSYSSRKQPPYPFGFLDAFDAEAEGGQAHREFLFAGKLQDLEGGPPESFFKIERARNS
jgi:hypothetical protein